jgi:hypothetical protein
MSRVWKWVVGVATGVFFLAIAVLSFGVLRYGWLRKDYIIDLAKRDAKRRREQAEEEIERATQAAKDSIADRVEENERLASEYIGNNSLGDTLRSLGVESGRESED